MTWAATVFEMNCSLKPSRACKRRACCGVFVQANLFQAKLFDLRFQFAILRAHAAQVEIVMPEIAAAVLRSRPWPFRKE